MLMNLVQMLVPLVLKIQRVYAIQWFVEQWMEPLYQQAQRVELKVQLGVQKKELSGEKTLETPMHKHQVDNRHPQNVVDCLLCEWVLEWEALEYETLEWAQE